MDRSMISIEQDDYSILLEIRDAVKRSAVATISQWCGPDSTPGDKECLVRNLEGFAAGEQVLIIRISDLPDELQ
jgi:hypothetical protein